MVEIISLWEKGWLDPKIEAFMWKQVCSAYQVKSMTMVPKLLPSRTNLFQFDNIEDALSEVQGEKVFVLPEGRHKNAVVLEEFKHPKHACYIFGNAVNNLVSLITEKDKVVTIKTPQNTDMFAISVVNTILYERR